MTYISDTKQCELFLLGATLCSGGKKRLPQGSVTSFPGTITGVFPGKITPSEIQPACVFRKWDTKPEGFVSKAKVDWIKTAVLRCRS